MAINRHAWGPNVVMAYEELGTTTDHRKCEFCGARGLDGTVVLLVRNADLDIMGNTYACDPCAAEATCRAEAEKNGGRGSSPYTDPNLRPRGRRRS